MADGICGYRWSNDVDECVCYASPQHTTNHRCLCGQTALFTPQHYKEGGVACEFCGALWLEDTKTPGPPSRVMFHRPNCQWMERLHA